MKHNKLVENLINQFPGDNEVYFKIPGYPTAIPLSCNMYEVNNFLVFLKNNGDNVTTINDLLSIINGNYYTSDEGEDEDFMVGICNMFNWDDDHSGFDNLLCINDAIQIDNKVILTTMKFNDDTSKEATAKLTIVGRNTEILNKFIKEVDGLGDTLEFNQEICIC